jgi:hypothetical protein
MIKQAARKLQLPRETVRVLSNDRLPGVAGGATTVSATCTLTVTTGPFPTHGACGGSAI